MILVVLVVGAGSWYGVTKAFDRSESSLSEETISKMIQQKYDGTIEAIEMIQVNKRQDYKLTLIKEKLAYDLIVNGQTGEVLSFIQQKRAVQEIETAKKSELEQETETTQTSEPEQSVQSNENNEPPKSATIPITENQAKQIASEKVTGTITSIELDDEDDQLVYEVEVDQSKTKEATVVINAYSGKIESITFETEEDDDDD